MADGWYICVTLEDETVPEPMPVDNIKAVVGVDLGLKDFLTTSEGETVPIQQAYRKSQKRLARQQRKLTRKQKGALLNYNMNRCGTGTSLNLR